MKPQRFFDENGRFILPNFARQRPFASFLPGIAGPLGIPMWVFTVNRGQAVASFGVENKDNPIMEFEPANKAYQTTAATGFRTFLKLDGGTLYEPFAPWQADDPHQMAIGMNELELQTRSPIHGLQTNVLYFTIPGEKFAGLARQVTVTNVGSAPLALEMLDGMARVIPFGADNAALKEIGRTLEAWMAVFNLEEHIPFYRLQASAEDTAVVETIQAGHFILAFTDRTSGLLPVIVDPDLVFGRDTALHAPERFRQAPLADLQDAAQITFGKTPCGFFGLQTTLAPGESVTLYALIGHTGTLDHLHGLHARLASPEFFAQKRAEGKALAQTLTDAAHTASANPVFDAYCRQTYLDNGLRGGWPLLLGAQERPFIYHTYSRKHGDLERDYNAFHLAAEPYSQGNGSYRDVNQNRRSDVWFNPRVGSYNILSFLSLIQADGYNPLVVEGSQFTLAEDHRPAVLALVEQPDALAPLLARPFTPGSLLRAIADRRIGLKVAPDAFVTAVLSHAEQQFMAAFGEGYWIDHWLYNLDLIDSYLSIYPERQDELLFGSRVTFYDSKMVVQPRSQKYVLNAAGEVRQYTAVVPDAEKAALIAARPYAPHQLHTRSGELVQTDVFTKLLILALLKVATLDPYGMGVEMEADRPGWYDALNGLPGLLGSGMPETYALQRLLAFLRQALSGKDDCTIPLHVEIYDLLQAVADQLREHRQSTRPDRDFCCWDAVSAARETYRERIRLGPNGRTQSLTAARLDEILALFAAKVADGIARAQALTGGVPPTYFCYRTTGHEPLCDSDGSALCDSDGRARVRPTSFEAIPLPLFLEGPVHAMKHQPGHSAARALHAKIQAGPLFDPALRMFKVNAPLESQSLEIGRARAFTPGWLENESIWLHMAYKYLLELLRAGLYDEFWEAAQQGLVPFMDPARYGRSPLENVSFIVSSAHPDAALHGAGFVARLTGATAEFLSMWTVMMAGKRPFFLQDGALHLQLQPALPGWLFTDAGQLEFAFLGETTVVYHNPRRQDTWTLTPQRVTLSTADGPTVTLSGPTIGPPYAAQVRSGNIKQIQIDFA